MLLFNFLKAFRRRRRRRQRHFMSVIDIVHYQPWKQIQFQMSEAIIVHAEILKNENQFIFTQNSSNGIIDKK